MIHPSAATHRTKSLSLWQHRATLSSPPVQLQTSCHRGSQPPPVCLRRGPRHSFQPVSRPAVWDEAGSGRAAPGGSGLSNLQLKLEKCDTQPTQQPCVEWALGRSPAHPPQRSRQRPAEETSGDGGAGPPPGCREPGPGGHSLLVCSYLSFPQPRPLAVRTP